MTRCCGSSLSNFFPNEKNFKTLEVLINIIIQDICVNSQNKQITEAWKRFQLTVIQNQFGFRASRDASEQCCRVRAVGIQSCAQLHQRSHDALIYEKKVSCIVKFLYILKLLSDAAVVRRQKAPRSKTTRQTCCCGSLKTKCSRTGKSGNRNKQSARRSAMDTRTLSWDAESPPLLNK